VLNTKLFFSTFHGTPDSNNKKGCKSDGEQTLFSRNVHLRTRIRFINNKGLVSFRCFDGVWFIKRERDIQLGRERYLKVEGTNSLAVQPDTSDKH